jgi:hypothetical protein
MDQADIFDTGNRGDPVDNIHNTRMNKRFTAGERDTPPMVAVATTRTISSTDNWSASDCQWKPSFGMQ